MAKAADVYFKVDPWKIIEEGYDPAYSRVSAHHSSAEILLIGSVKNNKIIARKSAEALHIINRLLGIFNSYNLRIIRHSFKQIERKVKPRKLRYVINDKRKRG